MARAVWSVYMTLALFIVMELAVALAERKGWIGLVYSIALLVLTYRSWRVSRTIDYLKAIIKEREKQYGK